MRRWIDQKAVGIRRQIQGRHRVDDMITDAQKKPTAFARHLSARVANNSIDRGHRDPNCFLLPFPFFRQTASTAIAMPMPPPMHSEPMP